MPKQTVILWMLLSLVPVYAENPPYPGNLIILDGALYLADEGLARYDLKGNNEQWRNLYEIQVLEPVAAGDTVLAGSTQGLYALATADGRIRWNIPAEQTLYSPTVSSGIAYFGGRDGKLRAVSIFDGSELWSRKLPGDWVYSPALSGKILITGGQDKRLWGIDAETGKIRWQTVLDQEPVFSPVTDGNSRVYVSTFSGRLTALNVYTGATLWNRSLHVTGSTPTVYDHRLYVPGLDGVLRTVAAASGTLLWEHDIGSRISGRPLVRGGHLLIATEDGRFVVLDAASGEELRDVHLGGIPVAGIAVYGRYIFVPLLHGVSNNRMTHMNLGNTQGAESKSGTTPY